ncbi:toxin-antitoxin system YwqK family antitoxin [Flavobacterium sp.]|uniref:toxin-antitoxin system YwqK family antitoxin n=1 Tax=Flavobacterium sp. TaxID=239 RepID=UPI003C54B105
MRVHFNKTIGLLPLLTFLFFGCNQKIKQEEESIRQAQKIPAVYKLVSNSDFNFKQDTLYFKNIKYSGKQYSLYPNKDTAFVKSYLNGMLEGVQKQWYPNKILAEKRLYIANKKEGVHKSWWENGKKRFKYHFYNDEFHGEVREWYETGQLFKIFHYTNGYEEGSERLWYEDGTVRANYVIKKGKKYGLIGIKLCKNPYETDK